MKKAVEWRRRQVHCDRSSQSADCQLLGALLAQTGCPCSGLLSSLLSTLDNQLAPIYSAHTLFCVQPTAAAASSSLTDTRFLVNTL